MNKVEELRLKKIQNAQFSLEDRGKLAAGFNTEFWKLASSKLEDEYRSLHTELEEVKELHELYRIQGELAALKILLTWPEILGKKKAE